MRDHTATTEANGRTSPLETFLTLFLEAHELRPGVHAVTLPLGERRLGLEAREDGDTLLLQCCVADALPPAMRADTALLEQLAGLHDLVATGRLLATGRGPVLEVEVTASGEPGSLRTQLLALFERIAIDCARLRGAAEGLAHVRTHTGNATPTPAPNPQAAAAGGRLWDRLVADSPELSMFRRRHGTAPAQPRPAPEPSPEAASPTGASSSPEPARDAGGAVAQPPLLAEHAPTERTPPPVRPRPAASEATEARRKRRLDEFAWALGPEPAATESPAPVAPAEPEPAPEDEPEDPLDWLTEADASIPLDPPTPSRRSRAQSAPATSALPPALEAILPSSDTTSSDVIAPEVLAEAPELLTPSRRSFAAASQRSARLQRQGDELQLLSWMDECADGEGEPDFAPSGTRRRATFSIPEALLEPLHTYALRWYRNPDRRDLPGELRAGEEAISVRGGYAPGDRSWRYRQPVLCIGRPEVPTLEAVYRPEPQQLSLEEVEAWLLSEGRLEEEEVTRRRRTRALRERSYTLRAEGDPEAAAACLQEALELVPDDLASRTALAHLHRKEFADPETAFALYGEVLEQQPDFVPALLGRAMLLVERDRHRAAEEAVQALALSPDDPDALELAGLVSLRAGRRARARALFLQLFRQDRARGEQALLLLEAERDGEPKWDPMLVIWERRALASGQPLDSVSEALYEERVRAAGRLEQILEDWDGIDARERSDRLRCLGPVPSYLFLSALLERHARESDPEVRERIEQLFLDEPTHGAMAIEDAIAFAASEDARLAAVHIAALLRWRDLLPQILRTFGEAQLPREVDAYFGPLLRFSGPEVAMALLAKLERGVEGCLDALLELLAQRPAPAAEQAARALRAVLDTPGALQLEPDDRAALEAAL